MNAAPEPPASADELRDLGIAAANAGRVDEALALMQRAVAMRPDDALLHALVASFCHALGKLDDAAGAYARAEALPSPQRALHAYNLGAVLSAQGEHARAEAAYRRALAAQPELAIAHGNLGVALHMQGKLGDAEAAYRRALAIEPAQAWVLRNLGGVLGAVGRHDEAVSMYELAIAANPDDADGHAHKGMLLAAVDQREAAIEALQQAITLRPDDASLRHALGTVLERAERLHAAREAYEAALERNGTDREALYHLAGVLRRLGERDAARGAYERFLALEPGNATARYMIAVLGGDTPGAAPADYVTGVFDAYAERYDQHMIDGLAYRAPALLGAAIRAARGDAIDAVLDLGCGTGLMGADLRAMATRIEGVDLSSKMLAQARARAVYDALHEAELLEHLGNAPRHAYDVITAADVFVYIGDLAPIIAAATPCLAPGGLLAFSVEALPHGTRALRDTGRFAHNREHLIALAHEHGLGVITAEPATLRHEAGEPVQGLIMVLRAPDRA